MGIRFIIVAGMVGTASLAHAGPVNFGGMGIAKATFAVGTLNKVGDFGRSGDALPAPVASPAPAAAPVATGSGNGGGSPSRPMPAPFADDNGNFGPANPAALGNGGVTGGPSAPPPFVNVAPAAPAPAPVAVAPAPVPVAAAPAPVVAAPAPVVAAPPAPEVVSAPVLIDPPAPSPLLDEPIPAVSPELLEVLVPPAGVPGQEQLPATIEPLADVDAFAVPEPSSAFLMLAGLLGAGALTRRKQAKQAK